MDLKIGELVAHYEDIHPTASNTVIILHGWGHTGLMWKQWAALWSEEYRVVVPDLPAFGKTTPLPDFKSVDDYTTFVHDFIKALNIPRVVLIGHSFGGQIAVKTAVQFPQLIEKVVLISPALNRRQKTLIAKGVTSVKWMKRFLPKSWRYAMTSSLDYSQASPLQQQILKQILREDVQAELPKILQPTLLIWGEKDAEIMGKARDMVLKIPQGRLKLLYDTGHNPQLDNPLLLHQTVMRFIS